MHPTGMHSCSQCYFAHGHLNNVSYNQAHSLIGVPVLAIVTLPTSFIFVDCASISAYISDPVCSILHTRGLLPS